MYLGVSNKYKSAITKPNREIRSKAIVNGITLDDSNIVTINIENSLFSGDDFAIGSAISSSFELTLNNIGGVFNIEELENKEIEIFLGTVVGDNRYRLKEQIEYVPMGIFTIEKAPKQKESITLSGFDRMIRLEKPYTSVLAYPATLLQIALEIASKAGLTLATINFTNNDYVVINKPLIEGITLREAIGYIAELSGGFARINRIGELEIFSISNTDVKITTSNFYEDFEKGDFSYGPIEKVIVDSFGVKAYRGNGENILTIKDNPFADSPEFLIDGIYNKLNCLMYVPFSTSWQGNPALDTGDRVAISDKVGITYNTIVTNNRVIYDSGLKYETKAIAKNKTAKEFKTQGTISKQVTALREKVVELQVNDDSIVARVEGTERELIGAGGIKERIQAAELKITAEAIVNTVRTSIEYNGDISSLQSQIIQTSSEIKAELTDTRNNLQSQISIQAGQISQKVSSGDVYSIITSSPTAIMIGFNDINKKVEITPTSFVIKDSNGTVTIQDGEIYAKALYASNGTQKLKVSGDYIQTAYGNVTIYDDGTDVFGGAITCQRLSCNKDLSATSVSCNTISVIYEPWASKNHYHSEFATINNEFTNVGNALNNIYGMIANLQSRVSALGG